MITNSFRDSLLKIVVFIFDNDKIFIKRFINDILIKSGIELKHLVDIELKNVFISDSLTFIKIQYLDFSLDDLSKHHYKDIYLNSDEVFNWIDNLSKNK